MSAAALSWRTPAVVITAGCLITILVFGVRSTMGIFNEPVSSTFGWGREIFALAMAIQNLLWGLGQPIAGAIADKYGSARVMVAGLAIYAAGVFIMAESTTPEMLYISGGFLIGAGMSASSFSVVLAAFGRLVPEEKRSWAFGMGTAAGSLGQFLVVPLGGQFLSAYGWSTALLLLGFGMVAVMALAPVLASKREDDPAEALQTAPQALREAFGHSSYVYLTVGFFVCGFQVTFLAVHFPAMIVDLGLDAGIGAWAIAVIGLFNVLGSYAAGVWGMKRSKKWLLCWIYALRSVVFALFIIVPVSDVSVLVFAAVMGLLWLSTVPATSGLVAQMFGIRHMGMLFGFVFFGHQIGAFLGSWLGGYLFDRTGSYDLIWWICVALGIFATIAHWPIQERAVERAASPA